MPQQQKIPTDNTTLPESAQPLQKNQPVAPSTPPAQPVEGQPTETQPTTEPAQPQPISETAQQTPTAQAQPQAAGQPTPAVQPQAPLTSEPPKSMGGKKSSIFSLKNCCCAGCILAILAVVALVVTVILARQWVVDKFNEWVTQGTDIPEVNVVDTAEADKDIEAFKNGELKSIELTEDELNTLIRNQLEGDADDEAEKADMRFDLEDKKAGMFFRSEGVNALPWIQIEFTSDDKGEVEVGQMKLGSITLPIGQDTINQAIEEQAAEEDEEIGEVEAFNLKSLLGNLVFGEDNEQEIKSIYFEKDKIRIEAE